MARRRINDKDKTPTLKKAMKLERPRSRTTRRTAKLPQPEEVLPTSPNAVSGPGHLNQLTPKAQATKNKGHVLTTPKREEFFMLSQPMDSQADVAWNYNSPNALRQIKIVHNLSSSENIAELVNNLANENIDLPPSTPPLLGLWMDKNNGESRNHYTRPHKCRVPKRKCTLKNLSLSNMLLEQLSAAIEQQTAGKNVKRQDDSSTEESIVNLANTSPELFTEDNEEDIGNHEILKKRSQESTSKLPQSNLQKFTSLKKEDLKDSKKLAGISFDLDCSWADGDDLFNDSSFILKATQIPEMQSPCSIVRTKKMIKENGSTYKQTEKNGPKFQTENTLMIESFAKNGDVKQTVTSNLDTVDGLKKNSYENFKVPFSKQLPASGTLQKFITGSGKQYQGKVGMNHLKIRPNKCKRQPITQTQTVIPPTQGTGFKTLDNKPISCGIAVNKQTKLIPIDMKLRSDKMQKNTCEKRKFMNLASTASQANLNTKTPVQSITMARQTQCKRKDFKVKQSSINEPCDKKNTSGVWDTSLSDDLLSQLAEPDELLESQLTLSQEAAKNSSKKTSLSINYREKDSTVFEKKPQGVVLMNKSCENINHKQKTVDYSKTFYNLKKNEKSIQKVCTSATIKTNGGLLKPVTKTENQVITLPPGAPDCIQETQHGMSSDDEVLCEPEILEMLDKIELQATQSQLCTQEEIEKKKQEALKRKQSKLSTRPSVTKQMRRS